MLVWVCFLPNLSLVSAGLSFRGPNWRSPFGVELLSGALEGRCEMGARGATRTITKKAALEEPAREALGQRKRPEKGQFLLQVDRQTKTSYATYKAAEEVGLAIKRGHPIVQVAVYDAVAGVRKIIEL